jgi:hypothetical protein
VTGGEHGGVGGVQRFSSVLKCGEIIGDVILAWGTEVVRVGGSEPLDLNMDDVVDVVDWTDGPPGR